MELSEQRTYRTGRPVTWGFVHTLLASASGLLVLRTLARLGTMLHEGQALSPLEPLGMMLGALLTAAGPALTFRAILSTRNGAVTLSHAGVEVVNWLRRRRWIPWEYVVGLQDTRLEFRSRMSIWYLVHLLVSTETGGEQRILVALNSRSNPEAVTELMTGIIEHHRLVEIPQRQPTRWQRFIWPAYRRVWRPASAAVPAD